MARLTVHEYAGALRPRYRTAKKGVKKRILDEFCQTTGMHRSDPLCMGTPSRKPGRARLGTPPRDYILAAT
jgi:hypothetical protein